MRRAQRLLLVAFALSLLIHAIVALLMHPPAPTLENRGEVVSIVRRSTIIAVRPPPPPPSRPRAPRNLAPPHPHSVKGNTAPRSSGGSGRAPATAPPAPVPTVQPTAAAAGCAQPNAPAAVVATPPPPDIPAAVRADATSGTAQIAVRLDATGQVIDTAVANSTGNNSLDLVAVAMARAAQYSAPLHDCKPVAGSYTYSVKFVAW